METHLKNVDAPAGSEIFAGQCKALKRVCEECGGTMDDSSVDKCNHCGKPRIRCRNKSMDNEVYCRIHALSRYTSIYNIVASSVADTTIDALVQDGKLRDLTGEFALAKLAIAEMHKDKMNAADRLEGIATFFTIAEKMQKIESGGLLNINWNDPFVIAMRNKFRLLLGIMIDIIQKYEVNDDLRKLMLGELKERAKQVGNSFTVRPIESGVDEVLALHVPSNSKKVDSSVIE